MRWHFVIQTLQIGNSTLTEKHYDRRTGGEDNHTGTPLLKLPKRCRCSFSPRPHLLRGRRWAGGDVPTTILPERGLILQPQGAPRPTGSLFTHPPGERSISVRKRWSP